MVGIPPAKDSDAEDVAWALQTAEALWKRNERVDAIVWLRRAAQAAGDANDDDRALVLAREAAELTDWMAQNAASLATMVPQGLGASQPPSGVDDLLRRSAAEIEVDVDMNTAEPPPLAPHVAATEVPDALPSFPLVDDDARERADEEERPSPPSAPPPSSPTMQTVPPVAETDAEGETPLVAVPTAEQVHAGMLSPWDERRSPVPPEPRPAAPPPADQEQAARPPEDEEEVVTSFSPASLRTILDMTKKAQAQAAEPEPPPPPKKPPPLPPRPAPRASEAPRPEPPRAPAPSSPTLLDVMPPTHIAYAPARVEISPVPQAAAETLVQPEEAPAPSDAPTPVPSSSVAPQPEAETKVPAAPPLPSPEPLAAEPVAPPFAESRDREPEPAETPALPAAVETPAALDLSEVEAFADLPDDAREAFAGAAKVDVLQAEEEVSSFALALVVDGEVDVSATIVDAPAYRLVAGAVLRARGTTEDGVSMRLVCASDAARVATWSAAEVEAAFHSCPWVEDDLRAAADRVQTLVGVTMGPFGERLDPSLREQVTGRLEMKSLAEGDVVVEEGKPVPGLVVVGVGALDLVSNGAVVESLGPGQFLFADAVLGAGPAPATARAGKGGALILAGDRKVAQELLVTCPPLLEIFAGM